jgi:hypothetical protein
MAWSSDDAPGPIGSIGPGRRPRSSGSGPSLGRGTADMTATEPGGLGSLAVITGWIYTVIAAGVGLAVGALPFLAGALLIEPNAAGVAVLLIAAAPIGPTLSATARLYLRSFDVLEPSPFAELVIGWRRDGAESLRVWLPALVVVTVLLVDIRWLQDRGTPVAVVAGGVLLVVTGILAMVVVCAHLLIARFAFRAPDLLRAAVASLVIHPTLGLGMVALGVVGLSLLLAVGDFVLLLVAPLAMLALTWLARPMYARVETALAEPGPDAPEAERADKEHREP